MFNKAGMRGGAIHSSYSNVFNDCKLNISNSAFYNNSAKYGGAISSSNLYYLDIFNLTDTMILTMTV